MQKLTNESVRFAPRTQFNLDQYDAGHFDTKNWKKFAIEVATTKSTSRFKNYDNDLFWKKVADLLECEHPTAEDCVYLARLFRSRLLVDSVLGKSTEYLFTAYKRFADEIRANTTNAVPIPLTVLLYLTAEEKQEIIKVLNEMVND